MKIPYQDKDGFEKNVGKKTEKREGKKKKRGKFWVGARRSAKNRARARKSTWSGRWTKKRQVIRRHWATMAVGPTK